MTTGSKSASVPYLLLALSAMQELLLTRSVGWALGLPGLHPSFFSAEKPTPDKSGPYAYIQVSCTALSQPLTMLRLSSQLCKLVPVLFLALSSCCCLDTTCENLERDFERPSQTGRGCLWNTTRKTCRLSMATCSSSIGTGSTWWSEPL